MTADDESAGTPEQQPPAAAQGLLRIYPPTDGPHAATLATCAAAFNNGETGKARRLAGAVVADEGATAEELEFARKQILARTAIDPVALVVGIGCFCLFWFTIYWYVWR